MQPLILVGNHLKRVSIFPISTPLALCYNYRMNWKRGLIRLWAFASVMWIALVAAVGLYHWQHRTTFTYAETDPYVETDRLGGIKVSPPADYTPYDRATCPIGPFPELDSQRPHRLSEVMCGNVPTGYILDPDDGKIIDLGKRAPNATPAYDQYLLYVAAAIGLPLLVLAVGAGGYWVSIGFVDKSGR